MCHATLRLDHVPRLQVQLLQSRVSDQLTEQRQSSLWESTHNHQSTAFPPGEHSLLLLTAIHPPLNVSFLTPCRPLSVLTH